MAKKIRKLVFFAALTLAFCNAGNLLIAAHIFFDHQHHNCQQKCPSSDCEKCPICSQYFLNSKTSITELPILLPNLGRYFTTINYSYHYIVSNIILNSNIRPPPANPFC